jgi:glycosyltransferase involved in cell wall biosynthesis
MPFPRTLPPARLLIVVPTLQVGGAERHAVFEALSLCQAGIDVRIYAMLGGGPMAVELAEGGVPWETKFQTAGQLLFRSKRLARRLLGLVRRSPDNAANLRASTSAQFRIRGGKQADQAVERRKKHFLKALARFRPDVVHVHTLACRQALVWAKEAHVGKTVYSHHNILSERHSPAEIASLGACLANADEQLFISQAQRSDFSGLFPTLASRGRILPPISGFSGVPRKKGITPGDEPIVVGAMSNLGRVKGIVFLLDAMVRLKNACVPIQLKIAGTGGLQAILAAEASRLGLNDCVAFTGPVSGPAKELFFSSLDIFVQPSLSEGLSIVLIEAMSYGLPLVASKVGGIPELIQEGGNGLLVPPGDGAGLADAIRQLAVRPDQRVAMGKFSRTLFECTYAEEKITACYQEIFLSPISASTPARLIGPEIPNRPET